MKRTSLIFLLTAVICGCENQGPVNEEAGEEGDDASLSDDQPCQYDDLSLGPDDLTPWGTKVADDMAALEIPVQGTWTWGQTIEALTIDQSGVQTTATAAFVHDPATVRYSEHVSGGYGVACFGPRVLVDGILTITDDQQAKLITSIPVTAQRDLTAGPQYGANPVLSPVSEFSAELHVLETFEIMRVIGFIIWLEDGGLSILFTYNGQSMFSETSGGGVITKVGEFL